MQVMVLFRLFFLLNSVFFLFSLFLPASTPPNPKVRTCRMGYKAKPRKSNCRHLARQWKFILSQDKPLLSILFFQLPLIFPLCVCLQFLFECCCVFGLRHSIPPPPPRTTPPWDICTGLFNLPCPLLSFIMGWKARDGTKSLLPPRKEIFI
ncbi:hypothetical protein QBC44DRAFT_24277 [Cladorrhinum sp. PSN332]|nr:hypothetical protein QBC44DRAFT_24277 [Cladorrhinum sp. PSN332]